LKLVLFIENSNSLKEKRMVLHSLKAKLRNHFNVAVEQVADEDKWQKTTLAAVGVARSRQQVNSELSQVVNFIERFGNVTILDYEIELL